MGGCEGEEGEAVRHPASSSSNTAALLSAVKAATDDDELQSLRQRLAELEALVSERQHGVEPRDHQAQPGQQGDDEQDIGTGPLRSLALFAAVRVLSVGVVGASACVLVAAWRRRRVG